MIGRSALIVGLFPALAGVIGCTSNEVSSNSDFPVIASCKNQVGHAKFEAQRENGKLSAQGYVSGIELLLDESNIELAANWALEAREKFPSSIPIVLSYADVWKAIEGPGSEQARVALSNALKTNKQNAQLNLNLAFVELERGLSKPSETHFQVVLSNANNILEQLSAHLGLSSLYSKLGRAGEAQSQRAMARSIFPDIDRVLTDAEIRNMAEPPKFDGSFHQVGSSTHPLIVPRIAALQKQLTELESQGLLEECANQPQ